MRSKWIGRALVAGLMIAVTHVSPAAARPTEEHCILRVVGVAADGEFETAKPECHSTYRQVAERLGVHADSDAAARSGVSTLSFTIGQHFDGFNQTGSSITVTGDNCSGGYINLSSDWRNRISSTVNNCPVVRFYNFVNLGGTYQTTTSNVNLTTLNNLADSIQYSS